MTNQPSAFLHNPHPNTSHPSPAPVQAWGAGVVVPVRRPPLPRAVPTLTVYADGFSCLNAEGSALASGFETASLCLHAPAPVRPGRQPRLWELSAGTCAALSAHPDKPAQLRFRVPPAEAPAPGRYALLPIAGEAQRFSLLPL